LLVHGVISVETETEVTQRFNGLREQRGILFHESTICVAGKELTRIPAPVTWQGVIEKPNVDHCIRTNRGQDAEQGNDSKRYACG